MWEEQEGREKKENEEKKEEKECQLPCRVGLESGKGARCWARVGSAAKGLLLGTVVGGYSDHLPLYGSWIAVHG